MIARRWLLLVLAGGALALLIGRGIAQVYTDYQWYASLGAADVWRAKYATLTLLRVVCAVVATLFVFANLYAVRQSVVSLVLPRRIGNIEFGEEVPRTQLTWVAAGLSAMLGLIFAWAQGNWSGALAARIGKPFEESDPYFAIDLGFWVYRLPLEISLFNWAMTMLLIVVGIVIVLYALTPSLRWEQGSLYISGYVRRHLAMLAGALLLALAWHYRLEMYTLLGSGSAPDGAFTSVDHRVGIPSSLLMAIVTLGAGLTVLWAGWTGQLRLAFAALTGVIIAALAARQVAPFIATRTGAGADRDPTVRERPYEATRAGYTRRAFAVDRVVMGDTAVTFASLEDAAAWVPVWDDGALRRANDRSVSEAAVGWFATDSGVLAVVPTTPGTGGMPAYAASVTEESGTPARASREAREPTAPPVFIVADSSARSVVVADSSGQIAAPALSSGLTRFAHALSMQDFRVWIGGLPQPSPKLVTRRGVRDRVRALAPFFEQGATISPVWIADSLVWTLQLYSAASSYPLSRRITIGSREFSYFQHAATALVNATTGRTVFVADSARDPVASTWIERFPRLFVRSTSLPMSLRRQLPAARDGARAQAAAFGRYGTRGGSDAVRHLPDDDGPDSALVGTPPPAMAFPRLGATGYVMPLLEDRTERVRGLFVAVGGATPRSIWLPSSEPAPIWYEALDRLRAVDTVSASLLVRGFVRAVPAGGDVVLLQPRYDWRGGGQPRLMYVAAIAGDSVRSARTLLQLAGRLPDSTAVGGADVAARALALYEEMRRAQQRGDWAAYGRAFDTLGRLLRGRRR